MKNKAPTDRNGNEINVEDWVTVHQRDGITVGVVVEATRERPTKNGKGWWIEIDQGNKLEIIMSHTLEVSDA